MIVWIHADCLSPEHPCLVAYPDAPAIFVWDDELLDQWQISLKRITFIYECLLELPVTIRRGNVAEEVTQFALEQGAEQVVTSASPSPRFAAICDRIDLPVEVLKVVPFVDYNGRIDLKRFSRYWRTVKPYVS